MSTRKGLWLIEKKPVSEFLGARLPSKEQVLLVFIHHHKELKNMLSVAAKSTSIKLQEVWQKANIPVMTEENIRARIQKLYKEYQVLAKEKSRRTETANMKRAIWKGDLDELFDIARQDVMTIKGVLEEDKAFLSSQREDRMSSSMSGVDKLHLAAVKRRDRKAANFAAQKRKHSEDIRTARNTVVLESSSSSSASSDEQEELAAPLPPKKVQCCRQKYLDPTLTSTWDREQLSVRQASSSFIAAAKSLGHDVSKFSVSPATVHRARVKNRSQMCKNIEDSVFKNPPRLVVHWDSKLLPTAAAGKVKTLEDRVAVIVTGKDCEHILGVPVAKKGTGREMALVVMQELNRFSLRDHIIGLSFDTTASNTGLNQGACMIIEKEVGRNLLWLACRHHTHELILKGVFEKCTGIQSSGPDILIFRKFKNQWNSFDKKSYTTVLDDRKAVQNFIEDQRVKMIDYLQEVIRDGSHPREDYKELLCLSLLFLGGWSESDFKFRVPGALHQARWMAKAIYALKIALFNKQFQITARELKGIRKVAYFVSLIYVRFWHEAVVSRWAPKNDLDMIQILYSYPDMDVRESALKVAKRHLWYLSETNVGLAFLDERITSSEREKMFNNLEKPERKKGMKRLDGDKLSLQDKNLSDFVTSQTKTLFRMFGVDDIDQFCNDAMRSSVDSLKVVNDSAERGIALIKKFNESVKDELQKQFLLKIVEHHRKVVTKRTKCAVASYKVN